MHTLFIGGIVLVALMLLLKRTRRSVFDPHNKTSLDKTGRIEQAIQQAKDTVYNNANV